MSETATAPRDVRATVKYVVRGEDSVFYAGDRDKSYWPVDEHEVTIHDVRPIMDELALEKNGFVVVDRPSGIADYTDKDQLAAYCRQTEELVARLTGAEKVVSFGPVIRTSKVGTHGHNQPAFGAHVDYGARTVADYTRDLLPADEAEERLQRRHILINVWRPIAIVESTPFAVCDASTVRREDLFSSEVRGGLGGIDRSLWGFNLAYRPDHKWYWLPDMRPSEALAFKLFDSDADAVQFTAHTAFELKDAPADAAPRQSIEMRTIAYL